jgi:hypothetical protein
VSDESGGYPGAPPGWYADPAGGPGQRWWDGYAWTEATALPSAPPPPPSSAYSPGLPPPPPGTATSAAPRTWVPQASEAGALVADELRISPLARIAIAFPGVTVLANLIFLVSNASAYREFGHQVRLQMDNPQTHQVVTVPTQGGFSSVLVLVALAALIVECVWQFRAATVARALRLPARRSPGWGVACWFIPIVNFWMPYQALRDCLAPDDPNRARVLRYWLCTLGIEIGFILTAIAIIISTPAGVILAILTGLSAVGVLATAPQVVLSIAVAHRAAVNP